jgi:hypothetical protein
MRSGRISPVSRFFTINVKCSEPVVSTAKASMRWSGETLNAPRV